jgi:3-deoxy-D-manno-octulosonic-acid transferase
MLFFVYDIVLFLGFFVYLPFYFKRKKITFASLKEKLGIIDFDNSKETIWIQVVSVGEVNLIESLIYRLREAFDRPIVISTTTLTGNRVAREKYGHMAKVFYFPLDVSWIVKRVVSRVNPKVFVAIETEIWPNVYRHLNKKSVPIIILNGRISDKAFKSYTRIRKFIGGVLSQCAAIGVQNETYKQRFLDLGAKVSQISITGNLKFKSIVIDQEKLSSINNAYAKRLKTGDRLLILAASTHAPEEEILIDTYREIAKSNKISLLLAPRHPERVDSIEQIVSQKGFEPLRLSAINKKDFSHNQIIIVDTVGDLLYLCGICDICFVGGSLSGSGGHNILEPVYFLKPTLFGPSMENFSDIEKSVLEKEASIKVKDSYELKRVLRGLIENQSLRQLLSGRCLEVFESGKHVLEDNLQLVFDVLSSKGKQF